MQQKQTLITHIQTSSCLFLAYHAVKAKVRAGKINVHADAMTTLTLRVAWGVFAEVLVAEAGELRVPTRAFLLPNYGHPPFGGIT